MKHFVCQHCGSGFSTSSGVSRHQKNNRCSGLKAIASAERQNTGTNSQIQTPPVQTVRPEIKQEDKTVINSDMNQVRLNRDSAMIQSMQYLQNIAAASNYPLSLAMQHRQDIDRQSAQHLLEQTNNVATTSFRQNL